MKKESFRTVNDIPGGFKICEYEGYVIVYKYLSSINNELLQMFDKENEPLYHKSKMLVMPRNECHAPGNDLGFYHRGSNIFLVDKNKLYIPTRSGSKDMFPGYKEISVGEHVKINETYEQAAIRGLKEELGQESSPLNFLFDMRIDYQDKNGRNFEWARYFLVEYSGQDIRLSNEAKAGEWVDIGKIKKKGAFRKDQIGALELFLKSY